MLGLVRSVADHAREVRVWTDGPERVAPSHKIQNERSVRWQKQQRSWMRRDRELAFRFRRHHRATSLSTYSDEFRLCTTDQFCIGIVYCCGWWSSFSFAGAGTSSRRTPTTTPWKLTVSVAELSRWTPCWRSQQLRPGCASASGIKTRLLARRLQPRGATTTNLRRARSGLACWV